MVRQALDVNDLLVQVFHLAQQMEEGPDDVCQTLFPLFSLPGREQYSKETAWTVPTVGVRILKEPSSATNAEPHSHSPVLLAEPRIPLAQNFVTNAERHSRDRRVSRV